MVSLKRPSESFYRFCFRLSSSRFTFRQVSENKRRFVVQLDTCRVLETQLDTLWKASIVTMLEA